MKKQQKVKYFVPLQNLDWSCKLLICKKFDLWTIYYKNGVVCPNVRVDFSQELLNGNLKEIHKSEAVFLI